MKLDRRFGVLIAVVLFSANRVSSRPLELPGNVGMKSLVGQSDLIILGTVRAIDEGDNKNATARIDVEKIYKGKVPGGMIEVSFDGSNTHCIQPKQDDRSLFFLRVAGDRKILADCLQGKLTAVFDVPEQARGASPEEELAKDLLKGLGSEDKTKRISAIQQLVGLQRRDSVDKIKDLVKSGDPKTRFTSHWALIKLGDYSEVGNLVNDLHKDSAVPASLRWNLASAVENMGGIEADTAAIRLTFSDDSSLVKAGVRALRKMKSSKAASRLVELLDSSDRDISYNAIAALDELEHGELTELPSLGVFSKNPDLYTAHWKKWWKTSGKNKYGK